MIDIRNLIALMSGQEYAYYSDHIYVLLKVIMWISISECLVIINFLNESAFYSLQDVNTLQAGPNE